MQRVIEEDEMVHKRETIKSRQRTSEKEGQKQKQSGMASKKKLAAMQRDSPSSVKSPNDMFELIPSNFLTVGGDWEVSIPSGWPTRGASKSPSHALSCSHINRCVMGGLLYT